MSTIPLYIVDEVAALVSLVSTKCLPLLQAVDSNISGVHYFYGHPVEIIETLSQLDKSGVFMYQKYPAICLFQDFPESVAKEVGVRSSVKLQLAIIQSTDRNYKAADRYLHTFKPILYPVYYELMEQIKISGRTLKPVDDLGVPHTKIDRLYWGREEINGRSAAQFNDYLDAIEIKDLELSFYNPQCQQGLPTNKII